MLAQHHKEFIGENRTEEGASWGDGIKEMKLMTSIWMIMGASCSNVEGRRWKEDNETPDTYNAWIPRLLAK